MKGILNFIQKRKVLFSVALVALILVSFWYVSSHKKAAATYVAVKRGTVLSEVSVTGTVKPTHNLNLAFQSGGRIKAIYVKVGDEVQEGQTLAVLSNADIAAQLFQAQASVKTEEATLNQLKVGTKPEDIKVEQSKLDKAKQDLANYYGSVPNILNDGYIKANDAVRQQADVMFSNSEQSNPQLNFQVNNFQIQNDVQNQRYAASVELNNWENELTGLTSGSSSSTLSRAFTNGESHLTIIRVFLYKLRDAVQNASSLSQTTISTYRANLTTALNEVNTALTNILNQEQSIASQAVLVEQTQNELSSELAGNLPEQINAQAAKVEQAKANAVYYESQLAKTILTAPFGGLTTRVIPSAGDIVATTDPVVSLIGGGAYEIEANIAESDIAKIRVGDTATVTMDAYGPGAVFQAKVAQRDLSATQIEGVATYKTTLQFLSQDARILAGLTANLNILSDKKGQVLYIPTRNIITEGDRKFVHLLRNSQGNVIEKIEIKTGLRGSDGMTEITSGLKEGDRVVVE